MNYNKIQKIISTLLIFFILTSFTIRVPFFALFGGLALADYDNRYNLVSIIVEKELYDSLSGKIERYAKDIQGVLENTKTLIVPTESETNPFNIASLNEKLYFEGGKGVAGLDKSSELIGTVIIGDLPLPVVFDGNKGEKTVLPYVDFYDKKYIYNHKEEKYLLNENAIGEFKAEIWHGIISPNTGSKSGNISAVSDYLDKNHDFYQGTGLFDSSKGVINGTLSSVATKPYVFYFDQIRENKAISYVSYKGYQQYLNNLEDLAYNRFSKKLIKKLKDADKAAKKDEIAGDLAKVGLSGLDMSALGGPDVDNVGDIQTRHFLKEYTKKFLEIFNGSTLGDFRKNVNNTGRYSMGSSKVNVDMIPTIIQSLDELSKKIVKNVNNTLEKEIDNFVSNGLSRKIAVPTKLKVFRDNGKLYEYTNILNGKTGDSVNSPADCSIYKGSVNERSLYSITEEVPKGICKAFTYKELSDLGIQLSKTDIFTPISPSYVKYPDLEDPDIVKGTVVEANRGLNVNNIQSDINTLRAESNSCVSGAQGGTTLKGYFGKSSPLWVEFAGGLPRFKNGVDLRKSIKPLYDVSAAASLNVDYDGTKPNGDINSRFFKYGKSFVLCNKGNTHIKDFISFENSKCNGRRDGTSFKTLKLECKKDCDEKNIYNKINEYSLGMYSSVNNCEVNNYLKTRETAVSYVGDINNVYDIYRVPINGQSRLNWSCSTDNILLNEERTFIDLYRELSNTPQCVDYKLLVDGSIVKSADTSDCGDDLLHKSYYYKKINSVSTHKEPVASTLKKQIDGQTAGGLPINKDRFVDFIGNNGDLVKIDYPYLFRLSGKSLADTDKKVKDYLTDKSDQLLEIYNNQDPSKLSGLDLEIYNILKGNNYPGESLDLYKFLKDKPDKTLNVGGEEKTLSYYDTLIFAIYWNSLKSVPSKYKFVFENYLSDQLGSLGSKYKFPLPLNKKAYEISYLGAGGDAANLYMKVDPENKGTNPYAGIINSNINLKNKITASNIGGGAGDVAQDFKCAPPEGVPIREWFPAVLCRLKEMLPPKIKIGESNCGPDAGDEASMDIDALKGCNKDENKNGIIDCFEQKIDSISLSTDANKYFYGKTGNLRAEILGDDGKRLKWASGIDVYFELAKVVVPKDIKKEFSGSNKRTLFDLSMESSTANSEETRKLMKKYINFKNISIKSGAGKAEYNFSTKSKDADISFRVFIDVKDQHGNTVISKVSDVKEIHVRGDRFLGSVYNISKIDGEDFIDSGASSVVVSNLDNVFLVDSNNDITAYEKDILKTVGASDGREKLVISLSNLSKAGANLPINYPIDYEIYRDGVLTTTGSISSINGVTPIKSTFKDDYGRTVNSFTKTGGFTFKFKDSDGFKFEKDIEFMPDVLAKIKPEMSTTIQETGGVVTTHLIKLLDRFDNLTKGTIYNLDIDITGGGLTLEGEKSKDTYTIYEGYKAFTLTSSNIEVGTTNVINFKVNDENEGNIFTEKRNLTTIKDIPFEVNFLDSDIKVGNLPYMFEIKINIPPSVKLNEMDRFNSRAYFNFPSIYGSIDRPYVEIKNNLGTGIFKTKTTANEELEIEVQIEGIRKPKKVKLTILPEKPIRTELTLDRSKIEASPRDKANLRITLLDRYGNVCFNDSNSTINLSVYNHSSDIYRGNAVFTEFSLGDTGKISGCGGGGSAPRHDPILVIKGIAKVSMSFAGGNPGIKYFKTKVIPSINNNSFDVKDEEGNTVTINGLSTNAGKIETFYFWNKNKIKDKRYNGIYTTLLGSNYGDITVKDYLAGSLIFNRNNRSLAVTSILNNPFKYDDVISISNYGDIKVITGGGNLAQNIDLVEDNNIVHIYNKSYNTLIGKVLYNFDKKKDDLTEIDFENAKVIVTRDSNKFKSKAYLNSTKGNIILFMNSSSYSTRSNYTGSSTKGPSGKVIWYRDPFETKKKENPFTNISELPYSRFSNESGIGWKGMNQTLLSFASGRNVGESTKEFMSFSLINIGDPVIRLNKVKKKLPGTIYDRQFEDSIGDILDMDVVSYKKLDYNKDGRDDIIVLRNDGHVDLYENSNIEEKFEYKRTLIVVSDLGSKPIMEVGDFTGDGYDDIFFVNGNSKPILYNNNIKDFVRRDLSGVFNLEGRIIQAEIFDMDADGKDDIVTFDDSGTINIFYSESSIPAMPRFSKKLIGSGLGIELSSVPRTDGGFIYFDDLYQLPEDEQAETVKLSKKIGTAIMDNLDVLKNGGNMGDVLPDGKINESAIDKLVFTKLNYNPENSLLVGNMTDDEKKSAILGAMPTSIMTPVMKQGIDNQSAAAGDIASAVSTGSTEPEAPEPLATPGISGVDSAIVSAGNSMSDLLNGGLEDLNPGMNSYDAPNDNTITTFIKSEYADTVGLDLKKIYTDRNGPALKSGDIIDVKISIKNNTSQTIDKLAFIDSIPKPFNKGEDFKVNLEFLHGAKTGTSYTAILKDNIAGGDGYLLDVYTKKTLNVTTGNVFDQRNSITLVPGEELIITYSLSTSPFKFGFIQAGLFEKGEVGDDIYGDIAFKPKKENCGDPYKMYRSTAKRTYQAGTKSPPCDSDKAKLPDIVEDNSKDADGNGVPDYIDDLTASATSDDKSDFQDYAKDALAGMNTDSDGDGIPDREDSTPTTNDDADFMENLDQFTENAMDVLEGVETFLNGLSCGFGGGGCISMPINAAPLAPGSSITVLGCPVAPAGPSNLFQAMSGIPIFSLLTFGPVNVLGVPVPPLWPTNFMGAGGIFGYAPGPLRIFLTPTFTGAIGTAICFGDNVAAPYALFPGIYPLLSGGNCIIAAAPLFGCSDDGSDGDASSVGLPTAGNGDFGVVNGNCKGNTGNEGKTPYLGKDNITDYVSYKKTGNKPAGLVDRLQEAFLHIGNQSNPWSQANGPLLNADMGSGPQDMESGIELDFSALADGNFGDILKIKLNRIWPFPDFIQSWVTRQVEEIVNKLTDFPTLFIILPDFSGIFDGWSKVGELWGNTDKSFGNQQKAFENEMNKLKDQIKALDGKCPDITSGKWSLTDKTDPVSCKKKAALEKKLLKMQVGNGITFGSAGGIKAAYELISNLPLLSIQPEPVYVNIPWIDKGVLEKTIASRHATVGQRKAEINDTMDSWSCGATCEVGDQDCLATNAGCLTIGADLDKFIGSIEKNIEILESYKKFPEDLNKLIRIKEVRLGQVLCYIDTIAFLLGGRIKKNGKIFKTWVELYVLIKAILKSWQLIIDIFYDFDTECHECKNERTDLRYCVFMLLSMLIPQIPIIVFPKWPDIILDLHNIRAGLIIQIPDFSMKLRPIILPQLPDLYLPKLPSLNINLSLPAVPILPEFQLPELPMLPAIPTIELPDLPPAPTLPKLFAALEAILTILKLLIKIYCLLQKSFLAPEWAAGQRIAHITERGGYLPLDFIPLELPQFSYPFIDAIKVTTYVNFEFETDFIVEFARQLVMPINVFSNNIANILNIGVDDLDFRYLTPDSIDVNVGVDGANTTVDGHELNYNYINNSDKVAGISVFTLAGKLAIGFSKIISKIDNEKDDFISNGKFLSLVNNDLNKKWIVEDSKFDGIRDIWAEANNIINSKNSSTNELITKLEKNSEEKFKVLKNIINSEVYKNNELKKKLNNGTLFEGVSIDNVNKEISKFTYTDFDSYNDSLKKFNNRVFDIYSDIKDGKINNSNVSELKNIGKDIIDTSKKGMEYFNNYLSKGRDELLTKNDKIIPANFDKLNNISAKDLLVSNNVGNKTDGESKLLASTTGNSGGTSSGGSACKTGKPNTYTYKGLYVTEPDPRDSTKNINYKLFTYLDDFTGDEEVNIIDYDNDGDDDLLYQIGNILYLKTNLKIKDSKTYLTDNPIVLDISDNKFYNGDIFYEAVNGFYESVSGSNVINLQFLQPTNEFVNNFGIEYYSIVDKFTSIDKGILASNFKPLGVKKSIIDAFSAVDRNTLSLEGNNDGTLVRKNLATLNFIGQTKGIALTAYKLDPIKDTIDSNSSLVIPEETRIYTGKDPSTIKYLGEEIDLDKDGEYLDKVTTFTIPANSNIEFSKSVRIIGITGNAYLKTNDLEEYRGTKLLLRLQKPLFGDTSIKVENSNVPYNESSHIDIKYYDGTTRYLMAKEFVNYKLLDLGELNDVYQVQIKAKNDFYYSKIKPFRNNIYGTDSNQVILAPQLSNDHEDPELNGLKKLRIPVYQDNYKINLKEFIYEDGGYTNIDELYFSEDSDIDGKYSFEMNEKVINVIFSEFTKIFKKKVILYIKDKNGNISENEITIEIYSPIPNIISDNKVTNIKGNLNETKLVNEPVSLYRVRSGGISKIKNPSTSSGVFYTIDSSIFNFGVNWGSGLTIKYSGGEILSRDIAKINEDTGKILNNIGKIKVIASNNPENNIIYPKIIIEYGNKDIYYQSFEYSGEGSVNVVNDFSVIEDNGVYLKIVDSSYTGYSISNNVDLNPGAVFVYKVDDINKTPLFTVFNDGRINLTSNFKLEYSDYGDYPVLNIVNKNNNSLVGRVIIRTDKSFIIK